MALFGKKKEEKDAPKAPKKNGAVTEAPLKAEEKTAPEAKPAVSPELLPDRNLSSVIIQPRITEKAAYAIDRHVYTFVVRKNATKHDVHNAIKEIYNVTPIKVNIVNKKTRHYVSRMRGRSMKEQGMRKAYVYLKEGDRIDLM